VAAVAAASAVLTACTAHDAARSEPAAPTGGRATAPASSTSAAAPARDTVWLCRPGTTPDPCAADPASTSVAPGGTRHVTKARQPADPPVDCFYVYPTVSSEPTANADLRVQPQESAVAVAQASRFSSVCRVYAPVYPQLTQAAISDGGAHLDPAAALTAFLGVAAAWQDYLAHDNHGRGVVFIGHSQGAAMLIALLSRVVDPDPSLRRKLVSAILLGGNVTVRKGSDRGGSFANLPACRRGDQSGCVVAYSSFAGTPPRNAFFGRIGTGIGAGLAGTSDPRDHVLCTNPAALDGRGGRLEPYVPARPIPGLPGRLDLPPDLHTPWVSFPDAYTATCRHRGGADWLQVRPVDPAAGGRALLRSTLGSRWGLHLVDVNIALGNLVRLVRLQTAAYLR
jgi:Protein of unknown function (DUF3089)